MSLNDHYFGGGGNDGGFYDAPSVDSPGAPGGIGGGSGGALPSAPGDIGGSPPSSPTLPAIPSHGHGHYVDEDKHDKSGHLSDDSDYGPFDSGSDSESEPMLPGEKGPASPGEPQIVYVTRTINLCEPSPTDSPPAMPKMPPGIDHEDDGHMSPPLPSSPIDPPPSPPFNLPPTPPDNDVGTGIISLPQATHSYVLVDAGVQQSVPFGSALIPLLLLFVMLF